VDLVGMHGCGCGPTEALAVPPGISQSRPHTFTEDLAFEGCEDGQVWIRLMNRSLTCAPCSVR
jgi:hypothetical protein